MGADRSPGYPGPSGGCELGSIPRPGAGRQGGGLLKM
nr:MAG TPA: hypothetical protein [Caudoviricetes sp.]